MVRFEDVWKYLKMLEDAFVDVWKYLSMLGDTLVDAYLSMSIASDTEPTHPPNFYLGDCYNHTTAFCSIQQSLL